MGLKTFPSGIHPHDNKGYSKNKKIENLPLPEKVHIFLVQHIGAPSKPIVKVGDQVLAGQKIAEPASFVSVPQHASISGKVTKIAKFPYPVGTNEMAIEITSDGEDKWVDLVNTEDYLDLPPKEMLNRISEAGITGMGGAGFPAHVKHSPPKEKPIDTIILNGVECEPYLTSDYRLMLEKPQEIINGLKILMKVVNAPKGIIGIESNKPDAIKLMQKLVKKESSIKVVALKVKYPQGAEKQLIYAATKRKVPNKGGLPMDVKVVVQNVASAFAIYEAVRYKKPLVERVVSVTGKIVKKPANVMGRIGTAYKDFLDFCEGTTEPIGKVISGGPMMGFSVPTLETSTVKGSNGVLVFSKKEAILDEEQTCIRCARCVDVCPMNLLPSLIVNSSKFKDYADSEKYGAMDCIRCGSCTYVCPANIKLVQWIDIARGKIIQERRKNK